MDPISNILNNAADYIEANGWCQFRLYDDEKACALGSILASCVEDGHYKFKNYKSFFKAINRLQPNARIEDICTWNSADDQTQEQVVIALREAASNDLAPRLIKDMWLYDDAKQVRDWYLKRNVILPTMWHD